MTLEECVYTEPNPFGGEDGLVINYNGNVAKYFELPTGETISIFPYFLTEKNKEMADGTIAESIKTKKYAAVISKPLSGDKQTDYESFIGWVEDLEDQHAGYGDLEAVLKGKELTHSVKGTDISVHLRKSIGKFDGISSIYSNQDGSPTYNAIVGLTYSISLIPYLAGSTYYLEGEIFPALGVGLILSGVTSLFVGMPAGAIYQHIKKPEYFMQKALRDKDKNDRLSKWATEVNITYSIERFPDYLGTKGLSISIKRNSLEEVEEELDDVIKAISKKQEGRYRVNANNLRIKSPIIDEEFEKDALAEEESEEKIRRVI